jgi:hypothetical protein
MYELGVPAGAVHLLGDRRIRFVRLMIARGFKPRFKGGVSTMKRAAQPGLPFSFDSSREKPGGFTAGRVGCFYFSHDLEQSGRSIGCADAEYGCSVLCRKWLTALQGGRQVNLKASPPRLYLM